MNENAIKPSFARSSPYRSGFTLLEVLICVGIIGVLATIIFPLIEPMRARAEKVVCISNLRSIHVSLATYVADHRIWPQIPEEFSDDQFDDFWIETLEPYGATERAWACPSIARRIQLFADTDDDPPKIHYLPATFDETPNRALKYPGMPWAMEIGSIHGGGHILIRADGGVREMADLLEAAGQSGVLDLSK